MAPDYDAVVHQQLGTLLAEVKNLHEAMRRSEDKSDASRASVHRRMDDMVNRVGKVETALVTVQDDIKEMTPVVDEVKAWKQRGIGGLFIVGIGASAVTFLITQYFSYLIARLWP
ncbi:DUF1515 domain-containing protein [Agrobacterium rhizogenes]|nr:DUF1515 domain-containing protein [Rhizobium rhizogenes]